jgi:hypothetical protein
LFTRKIKIKGQVSGELLQMAEQEAEFVKKSKK